MYHLDLSDDKEVKAEGNTDFFILYYPFIFQYQQIFNDIFKREYQLN